MKAMVNKVYLKIAFSLLLSVIFGAPCQAQNRIKKTDYEYDLVSGNVKQITYQANRTELLVQQYKYDADNRITEMRSSTDGVIFDRDAAYTYYQHGPLARTTLGDNKVQGLDYTYTIQGWLKAVNSNLLDPAKDPGKDGQTGSKTARDVFGFSLGYYTADYTAIGGNNQFLAAVAGSNLDIINTSLYNGNVHHMITSLTDNGGIQLPVQGNVYRYDQLNRLKQAEMFELNKATNSFVSVSASTKYKENFNYDANGNIISLTRNGNLSAGSALMDNLTYSYALEGGKKSNNRLLHVDDNVASALYGNDIDDDQAAYVANDPSTWNYQYDAIGNLISDKQEQIAEIGWNVAGKIKSVHRTDGSTKSDLEFKYDAFGHRICKIEKPAGSLNNPANWKYTYYNMDAQGNTLAVYDKRTVDGAKVVLLKEQYIYGSQRLGSIQRDLNVTGPYYPPQNATPTFQRVLGKKQYELSNHLGNVLEVISDKRTAHLNGSGAADYYLAQVNSATDYYAFGSPMPARDFISDNYRYGFNGTEKDNELRGVGNSYTTEFRQYDPRLNKWLSLDPKMSSYPGVSPFSAFNNNPIYFNDQFGDAPSGTRQPKAWEIHEDDVTQAVVDKFGDNNVLVNKEVTFEYQGKTYTTKPDNLTRVSGNKSFINIDAKSGEWKWTEAQRALNEALKSGQVVKATIVDDVHAKGLGLLTQEIEIIGQESVVKGDDIVKRVGEIADQYNFKALGAVARRAGQYVGDALNSKVKLPTPKIPKWVKIGKLVPFIGIVPGVYSMTENLRNGNESAATIDAIGLIVDPLEWYLYDISDAH